MAELSRRHALPFRLAVAAGETLAMIVGLGLLAILCALWAPLALPLLLILPKDWGRWVGRQAVMRCFRFYLWFLSTFCACRFELDELDALRDEQSLIIVANHPSLLDAVLLLSHLPNMACVMKAALAKNIILGAGARLAQYICNDKPLKLILSACHELAEGRQLLLFPEGTRTIDHPINTCTGSAGLIAQQAQVPVQALLIDFGVAPPYLGKRWPIFRPPHLPLHVRVRVGKRFPPPSNSRSFTRELEDYFRDALAPNSVKTPAPSTNPNTLQLKERQ